MVIHGNWQWTPGWLVPASVLGISLPVSSSLENDALSSCPFWSLRSPHPCFYKLTCIPISFQQFQSSFPLFAIKTPNWLIPNPRNSTTPSPSTKSVTQGAEAEGCGCGLEMEGACVSYKWAKSSTYLERTKTALMKFMSARRNSGICCSFQFQDSGEFHRVSYRSSQCSTRDSWEKQLWVSLSHNSLDPKHTEI